MDKLHCPECEVHIDEHPKGKCLDAWVAEKVMGWERHSNMWMRRVDKGPLRLVPSAYISEWEPSTPTAATWEVVEKMQTICRIDVENYKTGGYSKDNIVVCVYSVDFPKIRIVASSAPLAICRSAIKAVAG